MSSITSLPSTHPHLTEFRMLALEMALQEGLTPPLKRILAVGMLYDPKTGLGYKDRNWMRSLFDFCADRGIAIDPDFEVVPLNLHQGQDFLASETRVKGDILLSCFIPSPELVARENRSGGGLSPGWQVSPRHTSHAWKMAARETGARLIAAFHSGNRLGEIRARDFESRQYVPGPSCVVGDSYIMDTLVNGDWAEGLPRLVPPQAVQGHSLRHRL